MSTEKVVWFENEMKWKAQMPNNGEWVECNPTLPAWSIDGNVPAARFVRIWANSETLNEVKKQIFWLSLEQLEEKRQLISNWLEENGYQHLKELGTKEALLFTRGQLQELLDEGLIQPQEEDELDEREDYDAMKAVLEANQHQENSNRSHIETYEVGGLRFRARH